MAKKTDPKKEEIIKEATKAYVVPRFPLDAGFIKSQRPEGSRAISFDNDKQRNAQNINKGLAKPGYISYETLRRASRSVHVARICITVLKEKITKTEWIVRPKDPMADATTLRKKIEMVSDLLKKPNRNGDTWRSFIDKSVEDLLVLDAVAWEKTRYPNGELAELYQVDASTIHPVFNEYGEQDVNIPVDTTEGEKLLPVSYLQVLNYSQYGGPESGDITAAWPKKDFLYFHMHPQGSLEGFGFGLSPIESVLSVVTNILNADNYNGTYFEEGGFPPLILQLVGQMNERDLEATREYLIGELTGRFHRPAILAGAAEAKVINLKDISQRDMQFMEYTLFLSKLMAAAYGLSPQDIGLTDTVGSKNVSETQKDLSEEKGYSSILNLIKEQINLIVENDFGFDDIEFDWVAQDYLGEKDLIDVVDKALRNGTYTLNEAREKLGQKPFGTWANEPSILGGNGFMLLGPESYLEPQEIEEEKEENGEKKAKNAGNSDDKEEKNKEAKKSIRKSVYTKNFKVFMDDRGYSQPFIYQDIISGVGFVVKPPVAVNLMSQDLEVQLSNEVADAGVNAVRVFKKTFGEIVEALPPEVLPEFQKYITMTSAYDSEKWKAKIGGSRKFPFYLFQDFVDGYSLSSPLLMDDMKRDPASYEVAVKDLADLWLVEKELLVGDRRKDQYIISKTKRGYGFDYQFANDKERWERTKDSLSDVLKQVPELYAIFRKETGIAKRVWKFAGKVFRQPAKK